MTETITRNPFDINESVQIARYRPVNQLIARLLGQVSGLNILGNIYQEDIALSKMDSPEKFIEHALAVLGIRYNILSGNTAQIPNKGGLVVVANHPFGGIDGLVLGHLLKTIRPDVKILANGFLKTIPALESLFIDVDPINQKAAMQKNATSLKQAVRWVNNGGCLIIFPAGEVSHLKLREQRITDPEWSKTVAKLIKLTRSPVLPVFFQGCNSLKFQLLGLIHPRIRTVLLPRELLKKCNNDIELNIGHVIQYNRIKNINSETLIRYLRLTTYALGSKKENRQTKKSISVKTISNIIHALPTELLREEIKYLPENQTLHETGRVKVMHARAKQIPWLLQEIGRLRELTFREIGEGTGKDIDLDIYDDYYTHLFLWDKNNECLIGAYRLGLVDEIIKKFGIKGLYSYSLFKYSNKELNGLGPAIELGRSFIRTEYQRSPSSLSLLWKGIGLFIAQQGHYHTLFGPVSISNDYQDVSRKLIVDCLRSNRLMRELSKQIKPRKPYKTSTRTNWHKKELAVLDDINLVSELISQLEQGERGIPILIKQYIKLGGRFLEFNVDEEFNNALDGLIVVDLRDTEKELLEYFMGKDNANRYLTAINSLSAINHS